MKTGKLTARQVATAKIGKHGDGGGLWLRVRANGSRAWVFRYTRNGRTREMGLGPVESVPLATARERARAARELLQAGKDPIAVRRAKKRIPTFREAAAAYITAHQSAWKNRKHHQQWQNTIKTYADPVLGDLRVDEIETDDVLRVLNPIWETKTETATRVRGRIERVLDRAAALGFLAREKNPARWRGHLKETLAKPSEVRTVKHHAAMDWRKVPAFMVKLRAQSGIATRALEIAILTAARSGEVRGATWSEIDLDSETWTIPISRMKDRKTRTEPHRVPLSDEAVRVLRDLPRFEGSDYVFPSPRTGRPLSDAALGKVLRDLGFKVTAHGFRSSFRDWCAETTHYPREVAEAALAHTLSNKTEAAYLRGDLFEKRGALMAAWATYCSTQPAQQEAGNVTPIRGAR